MTTCIYVSPTGSDSNSGSIDAPLKTIAKAASLLQNGQAAEIVLRGGEYRETVTLNVSGAGETQPIILRGYEGETATINGCDPVAGWSIDTGTVYKAAMPWTAKDRQAILNSQPWADDQIFYNKKLMVAARWPSISPDQLPALRSINNARAGKCLKSSQTRAIYQGNFPVPAAGAWNGAKINYWGYFNNVPTTGTVISATETQIEFEDPFLKLSEPYKPEYLQPSDYNFFYLWGKREFLTDPGEWFRSDTGTLYFWPEDNGNPEGKVEAKKRLFGIIINGSNIHVKNLNLFACAIQTGSATNACKFENIKVEYTSHIQELYRLFWTFQKFGCRIDGKNHKFVNCSFLKSAASHMVISGEGHTVTDCIFTDSTYEAGHSTIFAKSNGTPNVFERCTFSGAGGHHVRIDKRTNYKYCYFEHSHRQTSDLGVFHSWNVDCEGTEIAYNIIRNNGSADYNLAINNFACCGLLLDHSTFNISIYRNIIYVDKSELSEEDASKGIVVLGFKADTAPAGTTASSPMKITIAHNSSNQKFGPGQNYPGNGVLVANNIFAATLTNGGPNGITVTGNWDIYNKNPRFHQKTKRDFRLIGASPVIGKGAATIPSGPWSGKTANPTPGALESGELLWTAGARVSAEELANLPISISWDGGENLLSVKLSLPAFKTLPENAEVLVGGKPLENTTILQQGKSILIIGTPPIGKALTITVKIGNFVKELPEKITTELVISGQQLFSQTATLSQSSALGLYCVRLNSAALVSAGKLDAKCQGLRLFGPAGEALNIWVESPNTEYTLVWFKSPSLKVGDKVKVSYPYPPKDVSRPDLIWPAVLDANCVLWLRANHGVILDSQGKVESWLDSSFEGRNGRGDTFDGNWRTPLARPAYLASAINGLPALSFDGNQGLDVVGDFKIARSQPRTIVAVVSRTEQNGAIWGVDNNNMADAGNFTGNNGVWSQGNDRLRLISQDTYSNSVDKNLYSPNGSFGRNATLILSVTGNAAGVVARLNGNVLVSSANQQQHYAIAKNFKVGRHQLNGWNPPIPQQFKGRIAEVLLFDRDIADLLPVVEGYLGIKYAGAISSFGE